ncbi:thioredoxin domain-containing protein [Marinicellulosiphila megalodicopiae]|uniref:thioredoxin domain-containing protein n=1 Tax=Marinicellulosiphila megalodicopiae TaxID=2724896 RepID=UPI003BAF3792
MNKSAQPKSPSFKTKLLKVMKHFLIFALVFFSIAFALDYWRGQTLPTANIPQSEYIDIEGNSIDLTLLSKDQLVVVYFWATWCTPCKVTTLSMKQLVKTYPVVSIAMASGENSELVGHFGEQSNIKTINDDDQIISKLWGVQVTPTILFIKNGQVLGHTTGISGLPSLLVRTAIYDRE